MGEGMPVAVSSECVHHGSRSSLLHLRQNDKLCSVEGSRVSNVQSDVYVCTMGVFFESSALNAWEISWSETKVASPCNSSLATSPFWLITVIL